MLHSCFNFFFYVLTNSISFTLIVCIFSKNLLPFLLLHSYTWIISFIVYQHYNKLLLPLLLFLFISFYFLFIKLLLLLLLIAFLIPFSFKNLSFRSHILYPNLCIAFTCFTMMNITCFIIHRTTFFP